MVCLYYAGKAVPKKTSGCVKGIWQDLYAVSDTDILGGICYYGTRQACGLSEQDVPFCEDGLCAKYQSDRLSSLWKDLCAVIYGIDPYLRAESEEKPCADPEEQIWDTGGICHFPVVPVLSGPWNGQSVSVL